MSKLRAARAPGCQLVKGSLLAAHRPTHPCVCRRGDMSRRDSTAAVPEQAGLRGARPRPGCARRPRRLLRPEGDTQRLGSARHPLLAEQEAETCCGNEGCLGVGRLLSALFLSPLLYGDFFKHPPRLQQVSFGETSVTAATMEWVLGWMRGRVS